VPFLVARRPWLIAAISLALFVAVLLGGQAAWRLGRRMMGPPPPPPRQTDVTQIADWMSVPYVSRSYRVPEEEIFRALGTGPEGRRMRPLRQIAEETGRSPDEAVEIVRQTVTTWQAEHTRPPPGEPGSGPDGPDPRRDTGGPKPGGPGPKPGEPLPKTGAP
jgi:hypothetical protein